jgi:CoA:oxalate CoA-transferase
MADDGFKALDILQTVEREDNVSIRTTRSPLRFDGTRAGSSGAAPRIGEDNDRIREEFSL